MGFPDILVVTEVKDIVNFKVYNKNFILKFVYTEKMKIRDIIKKLEKERWLDSYCNERQP
ncbi:MAG: hypothetical protein ACYCTB_03625 [bacterium]